MDIYIVRHGQTDSNVNKERYGGRVEVPLNKTGQDEAKELKKKLDGIIFDRVYSSPLSRALETARIISGDSENIVIDERLIERSNGDLEGRLRSEIPDKIDFNNPEIIEKYNIETEEDIKARVKSFFDEISNLDGCDNVLVVTHAGTGMYARRHFDGEPEDGNMLSYKLNNCDYLVYTVEKGKVLKRGHTFK